MSAFQELAASLIVLMGAVLALISKYDHANFMALLAIYMLVNARTRKLDAH